MTESDGEDRWLEDRSSSYSWTNQVIERLKEHINNIFSLEEWHNNRIIQALETQEGIEELISYKLNTKPAEIQLPQAISLKFKYFDISFFTSFTNNKRTTPAHQSEFTKMLKDAINKYKDKNKLTLVDRVTRDRI